MKGWSEWKAKFSSKCGVCGREIPVGATVHGTKDPAFSGKGGKWFVVCPDCYADGPKPKTLGSVAAEIEEMKTAGAGAPPPKFPTDVDALAAYLKGSAEESIFSGPFTSDVHPSCRSSFIWPETPTVAAPVGSLCGSGKGRGVDPHPTSEEVFVESVGTAFGIDAIVADLDGKIKPKPWTLLWLREQAPWCMA